MPKKTPHKSFFVIRDSLGTSGAELPAWWPLTRGAPLACLGENLFFVGGKMKTARWGLAVWLLLSGVGLAEGCLDGAVGCGEGH
jgi:hypothetical protein